MNKELPLTEGIFYILLALDKPNHGYGIIQEIQELTKNRLIMGAGTLYGAINNMLEKGWIQLHSVEKTSRKKKEYLITAAGREMIALETERLKELIKNSEKMMGGHNDESI